MAEEEKLDIPLAIERLNEVEHSMLRKQRQVDFLLRARRTS